MRNLGTIVMTLMLATQVRGEIVTLSVRYQHGDTACVGYLACDDAVKEKRPGVLVVHEWWGLNDFAKEKTRQLAELGYVAFAVDMYGGGTVATDSDQAGKLAGQFRANPTLWRERAQAAYGVLAKDPRVDSTKIAAIGFCFGGSTVLQMAAAGLDLAGVVSFHGSLIPFSADDAKRVKARLLVLHGDADTHVSPEVVAAFEKSLRDTPVDWQLVTYSGAKHAFMNPDADKLKAPGIGYDEKTAQRAWQQMRIFFDEVLGPVRKQSPSPS
jgi:dienelactone hydrolase